MFADLVLMPTLFLYFFAFFRFLCSIILCMIINYFFEHHYKEILFLNLVFCLLFTNWCFICIFPSLDNHFLLCMPPSLFLKILIGFNYNFEHNSIVFANILSLFLNILEYKNFSINLYSHTNYHSLNYHYFWYKNSADSTNMHK